MFIIFSESNTSSSLIIFENSVINFFIFLLITKNFANKIHINLRNEN